MQPAFVTERRTEARPAPLLLRIGFWLSLLIAVAVVIRRLIALASPVSSGPPGLASMDQTFRGHAALTLAHIIPALAFVLLTPIVLFRSGEWVERLFFVLGAIVGTTAYAMSIYSFGGWTERSAVLLFDTIFLYSLWRAYRLRDEPVAKRRWILRAVVVLLGIATTRPVMGLFFATSPMTHLRPDQFFGIAFWIGFSINFFVVEIWLGKRWRE